MSEERIIGIDLGTTNTVVAIVVGNEPEVIPNTEGSNKTPSVVAFLENNEVVVGEIARRQAATNSLRTITSVKRLMGRSYADVTEAGDRFPYKLVNHEGELLIDIDNMGYRPEQVSALIVKKVKESAEAWLDEEVKKAVITVPAYFDDMQRQATIEAAEMAGLEVLRLINEPTAAAMAYGMGRSEERDEIVAIYDFGGGTFDISIMEISGKTFEVLTSTGDTQLGGDDLDNRIVEKIVEEFLEKESVDLMRDPVTLRRLKEVAERAKCELSTTSQTQMSLPFLSYRDGQPLHLDRILTRREFEDLIDDLVRATIRCCKRALEETNMRRKDISRVILVGGTTRIPLVQDSVEEFFDQEAFRGVNPDEVVALGAATQAGVFEGNVQEVVLLDVTPHSLGIEVEGGTVSQIIEKNSTIPIKAAKTFTTTEDNQEFVVIHVLQGESSESAENRSLGRFTLSGLPPADAGIPRIRVTFFINADGVMEISAEDMNTGLSENLTIVHSQLSEEEESRRRRRRTRKSRRSASTVSRRRTRNADSSVVESRPPRAKELPAAPPAPSESIGEGISIGSTRSEATEAPGEAGSARLGILGDTSPGDIRQNQVVRAGHARPSQPLEPVDYSNPPMYTPTHGPDARPASKSNTPSRSSIPAPPADLPTGDTQESATVMQGNQQQDADRTLVDRSSAATGGSSKPGPEVDLPELVNSAIQLAKKGQDDASSQNAYTSAIEVLNKPPYANTETWRVLEARVLLHSMAGMLEETRTALRTMREKHIQERPADALDLHEKACARFDHPSLLRDRGMAKELAGDLAGACADIEQAHRQEPLSSDRDYLEALYRRRAREQEDPQAQFKLVKILLKNNQVDEAIEILQELQRHDTYEARALKVLGLCFWQKNMHYMAWQKFKALSLDEDLKDILYRLAGDMESIDQLHNAVAVLEHLQSSVPGYRDVEARLRKLNYRLKLQQEESQSRREVPMLGADSRFVIEEEINRGSMGIIFKARDKILNEIVALKILNDYLGSDPAAVERFKSEARAAKKLSHPYIVRIHDFFESGNKRYISMEYIEGSDLKRLLSERTTFTEEMILYYFMQICDALSYAHKLGIVHRDIKPANIMITQENAVKITDFGIAKILQAQDATNSGTAVIGTPLYMAPEQIIGEKVDGRTDIYALGIMLYEMVSGNPPFYLGNIEYHHIHTAPPALPDKVSPPLRTVIMKMIAKKPADRFQKVEEIVPAIRAGE